MSDLVRDLRGICGHDSRSVEHCVTCEAADRLEGLKPLFATRPAESVAQGGDASILGGLDWEPDENHTVSDMANVGRSLMKAIAHEMPGYCWNESPAEIVGDLINERDEARATPTPAGGDAGVPAKRPPVEDSQFCDLCGADWPSLMHDKGRHCS